MVPDPGLGVDGLPDGAQDAQRFARVLGDVIVAKAHEGADRGRRGVEYRYLRDVTAAAQGIFGANRCVGG